MPKKPQINKSSDLTISIDMLVQPILQWERQQTWFDRKGNRLFIDIVIIIFSREEKIKTREDERMVKMEFLSKLPSLDMHKK